MSVPFLLLSNIQLYGFASVYSMLVIKHFGVIQFWAITDNAININFFFSSDISFGF